MFHRVTWEKLLSLHVHEVKLARQSGNKQYVLYVQFQFVTIDCCKVLLLADILSFDCKSLLEQKKPAALLTASILLREMPPKVSPDNDCIQSQGPASQFQGWMR
eukprot:4779763-Amphidinium_carterae.1